MIRHLFIIFCLFFGYIGSSAKVPVYIIAGQSNADGRAVYEEMPPAIRKIMEDGGLKNVMLSYCNGTTRTQLGSFVPYIPTDDGVECPRFGFETLLVHCIDSFHHKPIYIIKEAKGGTAIDTLCKSSCNLYWNASSEWLSDAGVAKYDSQTGTISGKSLLLQLEANIDSCINRNLQNLYEGYEFKCVIWHQGESDRKAGDSYYSNLRQLVEHLRCHIAKATGDDRYLTLPFIAGGISRQSRQYNKDVEQAKESLAVEDPHFHYVNLDGCELRSDDQLHFNGKGCREVAMRIYETMKNLNLLP